MSIYLNLNKPHSIVAATSHYYKEPTEERYIDRTLQYHDLIYLIDGHWAIAENDTEYLLQKGDVLLLAAGRHHYTRLPCEPGTRTFCIHVSCEEGDQEDFPDSVSLPTLMHMDGEHGVKHYFEAILSAHWSENSYKQERLSALFNLLILELANSQNKQRVSQNDLADKAIEIITATPHHKFQAKEIAQALFVSERTLNNAMNLKTGMPFYAYQKNLKLEMAALQLVMEPDLRLSEIATAFGFHDQFHLSNAFKQKFGISPQQYRQMKRPEEV